MTKWIEKDINYERKVGIFTLCIWPLKLTRQTNSFCAWGLISGDGDSITLPSIKDLHTLEEAKQKIEQSYKDMLKKALGDLS